MHPIQSEMESQIYLALTPTNQRGAYKKPCHLIQSETGLQKLVIHPIHSEMGFQDHNSSVTPALTYKDSYIYPAIYNIAIQCNRMNK